MFRLLAWNWRWVQGTPIQERSVCMVLCLKPWPWWCRWIPTPHTTACPSSSLSLLSLSFNLVFTVFLYFLNMEPMWHHVLTSKNPTNTWDGSAPQASQENGDVPPFPPLSCPHPHPSTLGEVMFLTLHSWSLVASGYQGSCLEVPTELTDRDWSDLCARSPLLLVCPWGSGEVIFLSVCVIVFVDPVEQFCEFCLFPCKPRQGPSPWDNCPGLWSLTLPQGKLGLSASTNLKIN